MSIRVKVVALGTALGSLLTAVPTLLVGCVLLAGLGGFGPKSIVVLAVLGAAPGVLPGAAMGAALAWSPRTVWERDAHRSLLAGAVAAGTVLTETVPLALATDDGRLMGLGLLGAPVALITGWFLSTPITAPLRRAKEAGEP
ncbi:hypothetical protein [Kitasatospora sp. NPDC047058]|uniref:hypothetical protein n=1 Tax=Kitasatospora sp. NPDC047058 TaxID=3155620 RepID=UPI00340C28AE